MSNLAWSLFVSVFAFGSVAMADAPMKFDHTHGAWDGWLKKYVVVKGAASTVNYKEAKKNPKELNDYINSITKVSRKTYDSFSKDEKLAFLINAYNALTVKLIVDNYPVDSIKDLGGLFSSPWKKKFFTLLGQKNHLDGIEHGMIREDWDEPRIHFAVVCASIGCPMLSNEAWVAERIEEQLERGAKNFLSDRSRNRYEAAENKFYLSKIFDWYKGDFTKGDSTVQKFVSMRMAKDEGQREKMQKAEVDHMEYNWKLNETK